MTLKTTKEAPQWLELRVGEANDKAKDYFTKGDIEFIKKLLSHQTQEIKKRIELMKKQPTEKKTNQKLSYMELSPKDYGYNSALDNLLDILNSL